LQLVLAFGVCSQFAAATRPSWNDVTRVDVRVVFTVLKRFHGGLATRSFLPNATTSGNLLVVTLQAWQMELWVLVHLGILGLLDQVRLILRLMHVLCLQ